MNKKGFTVMELLAVIVILGILSGLVTVGVTRYRQDVREKELINLHSTIEATYNDYRSDSYLKGEEPATKMNFCTLDNKMIMDIAYNGEKLTCEKVSSDSYIEVKIKGKLLNYNDYTSVRTTENDYIKDGTCVVKSKKEQNGENYVLTKHCERDGNSYVPSKEEITCIYLKTNNEILINDFDKNGDSLCKYFEG